MLVLHLKLNRFLFELLLLKQIKFRPHTELHILLFEILDVIRLCWKMRYVHWALLTKNIRLIASKGLRLLAIWRRYPEFTRHLRLKVISRVRVNSLVRLYLLAGWEILLIELVILRILRGSSSVIKILLINLYWRIELFQNRLRLICICKWLLGCFDRWYLWTFKEAMFL